MLDLFHDLKVVNNLAEHCVKDMEEFINFSKDEEHRKNILFVAADHRKVFQDLRKSSLQKEHLSLTITFCCGFDFLNILV